MTMTNNACTTFGFRDDIPYSVVALETEQPINDLLVRLASVNKSFFGTLSWSQVSEHRIIVVIQGLDQLGDILSFLKSTFGRLCSPEDTGFGIARYPLEALNFNDLVSMSTQASTSAFNNKSAYQVSNGNPRRQNLYRKIRESYARSA